MDFDSDFLKKFHNPENKKNHTEQNKKNIDTDKNKMLINEFNIDLGEHLLHPLPDKDYFISCYKKCFELIYGVREKKAKKFNEQNIKSLEDLSNDIKYSGFVKNLFKILDDGFHEIKKIFGRRFSSSHKMAFLLLSFFKKEDLLFLDIETMTLFPETQIITIGCGFFQNNNFKTIHLTALNEEGEYEILNEFKKLLETKKAFVTFNGKSFDVPFIDMRMSYYNIENNLNIYHNFDLLFFTKKAFKGLQKSFTLKEIDKNILKKYRKNDISGDDVFYYYNKYKITKNMNFLKPIINHNKEDILSIALLLHKLISVWCKN
ncbi:MAG: ribonuclease H-like domain-containing protein [Candidatus Goldbacteria bacterium]|nr:ribonuclease H-like domain-containing protein [Candidatus Goldiibacteriota bacterium]